MTLKRVVQIIGAIDLLNVAYYAYRQLLLGRLPLVDDVLSARAIGADMPTLFPPPLFAATFGAAFLLSMIGSGILLLRGDRVGGWMAIAQTPFRPLTWWSAAPLLSLQSGTILPLVVGIEISKVIVIIAWLWKGRTSSPTAGNQSVTQNLD